MHPDLRPIPNPRTAEPRTGESEPRADQGSRTVSRERRIKTIEARAAHVGAPRCKRKMEKYATSRDHKQSNMVPGRGHPETERGAGSTRGGTTTRRRVRRRLRGRRSAGAAAAGRRPGADRSGIADRTRSPVRRMRRLEETADEPGVLRSSAGNGAYCTATVDSRSDSSRKQFDGADGSAPGTRVHLAAAGAEPAGTRMVPRGTRKPDQPVP